MSLVFAVNGERVELDAHDVDPKTTLNDYLRRKTRFTGTKLACGEAGCGACTVDMARWDAASGKVVHSSINSCIRSLAAMEGYAITTTEGLGSSRSGFHPIQDRIASLNGTQCGFCTPGFVMATFSMLNQPTAPTAEKVEQQLDGNICRCTGYRPILDAAKSFSTNGEVKDHICGKQIKCGMYDKSADPVFPEFLKTPSAEPAESFWNVEGQHWVRPHSVDDTLALLAEGHDVRIVGGDTCKGIYKKENPELFADVHHLAELKQKVVTDAGLTVGSATTLTELLATLEETLAGLSDPSHGVLLEPIGRHILRIASTHVRNVGSVAGNIVMAKTRGFLSDLATVFVAASVTVTLGAAVSQLATPAEAPACRFARLRQKGSALIHKAVKESFKRTERTISVEQFLAEGTAMHPGEMVLSFTIPFVKFPTARFNSYRVSLRPQFCHAYVNAAFYAELDDGKLGQCVLAFGGVQPDAPGSHAQRASQTEKLLQGASLTPDTITKALASLHSEICPDNTYRQSLVTNLLFKFLTSLDPSVQDAPGAAMYTSCASTSGHQAFTAVEGRGPISQAVPKTEGWLQASGEARFTDDTLQHCIGSYAALVTTTEARAKIVSVDASAATKLPGVIRFIGPSDLSTINGKNNCLPAMFGAFPLFAEDRALYWGQPLGVIVADTEAHAQAAAKAVVVQYDREGKTPILTIEAALVEPEFISKMSNECKGGEEIKSALEKGAHRLSGKVKQESQKHFYMEPISVYAQPDEGGSIKVQCSTQWPDGTQAALISATGLPANKVQVIHRRAGGAFGGKISGVNLTSCACAVAALVLGIPVRLTLGRSVDMLIQGGREESLANYDVSFDDKGRISALEVLVHFNAGTHVGFPMKWSSTILDTMNQVYQFPNFHLKSVGVLSNMAVRTPVRGPAEIDGSYIIETILEQIAVETNQPAQAVRELNMYDPADTEKLVTVKGSPIDHYTMPEIWTGLSSKIDFEARSKAVDEFNAGSQWRKRGIATTPVKYGVTVWPREAIVNIYGDGSVVVIHCGSEMGQGANTKVQQVTAYELGKVLGVETGIPIDLIRFGDIDTLVLPNALWTGGSTGSEGAVQAAAACCKTLVGRMAPVMEGLKAKQEEGKDAPSWLQLCMAAKMGGVNLSVQDRVSGALPMGCTHAYSNFGAATSQVEVDVLTGEVQVQSVDMHYDCGVSLNPAIDIGQCEGAFMMGVGRILREEEVYNVTNGEMYSNGTWEYKPPLTRDVPTSFNVELINSPNFDKGILSSKASGEPPLVLSTSVAMAVRQAVTAARKGAGLPAFVPMPLPMTPEVIANACATKLF